MNTNKNYIGNVFTNLFILSIGIMFLIPAAYKVYTYISFNSDALPTTGIVNKEGVGRYIGTRPFIKYTDRKGNTHEFRSEINFYWMLAPKKGDQVDLLVLKNSPDSVIVNVHFYYIFLPLIFSIVGLAIVVRLFLNLLKFVELRKDKL